MKPQITDTPKQLQNTGVAPLTSSDVGNMQAALHRLAELNETKLVTKNSDAEKQGLQEFLRNGLVAHASELLGSWVVCNQEYVPLLHGVGGLLRRIDMVRAEEQARRNPTKE